MAGLVPAIHVLLVESLKDVDARQRRQVYVVCARQTTVAGHDVERFFVPLLWRYFRPSLWAGKDETHPANAAFTMPLALPKSICPAYFAFSAAITLPMSFIPAALVSAMTAAMAALTSSSDICFGR